MIIYVLNLSIPWPMGVYVTKDIEEREGSLDDTMGG